MFNLRWIKSSYSFANGNCAEAAVLPEDENWRKSLASAGNGECAEVGQDGVLVLVRDTMDRSGPWLMFPVEAWTTFTKKLKKEVLPASNMDRAQTACAYTVRHWPRPAFEAAEHLLRAGNRVVRSARLAAPC